MRVVSLPARGALFQADGVTPIDKGNTAVADPAGLVMYLPHAGACKNGDAISANCTDVIAYAAVRNGSVSAPAMQYVTVVPLVTLPALLRHSRSAVCSQGAAVQVHAAASPGAQVHVTKLPGRGELRQVSHPSGQPGTLIAVVGTMVTHPAGRLVYTPQPNVHGRAQQILPATSSTRILNPRFLR